MNAAQKLYGTVEDLPFPSINPAWTLNDVRREAEKYYPIIRRYAVEKPVTVHLMGEQTFCFVLLEMLRAVGIPAVASTSERLVQEESGIKSVRFEFVAFRPYYNI